MPDTLGRARRRGGGALIADVQNHTLREMEGGTSTCPGGKALLVIGVVLNCSWEARESGEEEKQKTRLF